MQRVRVVLAEEGWQVHRGAAALAELPTFEVEVFSDTGCIDVICLQRPAFQELIVKEGKPVRLDYTAGAPSGQKKGEHRYDEVDQ